MVFPQNGLGFYKWYSLVLGQLRETDRSQRKDKHNSENKREIIVLVERKRNCRVISTAQDISIYSQPSYLSSTAVAELFKTILCFSLSELQVQQRSNSSSPFRYTPSRYLNVLGAQHHFPRARQKSIFLNTPSEQCPLCVDYSRVTSIRL